MAFERRLTPADDPLPEKAVGPNSTFVPWRNETLGLPPKLLNTAPLARPPLRK